MTPFLGRFADKRLPGADEEKAAERVRDLDGLAPLPGADLFELREVPGTDPKDNVFGRSMFGAGPVEEGRELAEGARTDEVKGGHFFAELLIAAGDDLRVLKSQFSNDFREKSDLFDIRFDEKNAKIRTQNFEGKAGKTTARAYVGEPTRINGDRRPGVHAFTKMTI